MSQLSLAKRLRATSSILALSSLALLGVRPASADPSEGIFGGGSTLASLALRQEFDCWADHLVKATGPSTGVGGACSPAATLTLGLYAGVGSGNGQRAYIANRADHLALGSFPSTIGYPAVPPEYVDGSIASPSYLTSYPYPHLDFVVTDSPLGSNLLSGLTSTTYTVTWAGSTVTAAVAGSASYDRTHWGDPIQLPLFEAPVAIAINVPDSGANGWTILSQLSPKSSPGGAIQLSTAQVCAIFSGLVTNWNDTTTNFPYLRNDGTTGVQRFSDDNNGVAYHSNKAITIVYRSDAAGTSFILTNYLKTVCPLLDPSNTYGYQSIYNTSVLPNNSFTQLINKVTAYGRNYAATVGTQAYGGDDWVATAIGNSSAHDGYIGYVGNNFVQPYNTASTAPFGASLQNDYLRLHQVYHPGQSGDLGAPQNFIAPTPTSADAAWAALAFPATTWTFNDYNVYAQVFGPHTNLPGSPPYDFNRPWDLVDIGGLSILPWAGGAGAYSLVGTAFGLFYSCYGDTGAPYSITGSSRAGKIKDFLTWLYNVSGTSPAPAILTANGYHPLPRAAYPYYWPSWIDAINAEYLNGANPSVIAYPGAAFTSCYNVTGGAQG